MASSMDFVARVVKDMSEVDMFAVFFQSYVSVFVVVVMVSKVSKVL